jgi:hypothetical protein
VGVKLVWVKVARVKSGSGHDGQAELFRGNLEYFRRRERLATFLAERRDPAVAASNHGLQKSRLRGIVFERNAYFSDRGIDSLFDVDERIRPPQGLGNLRARHQPLHLRRLLCSTPVLVDLVLAPLVFGFSHSWLCSRPLC